MARRALEERARLTDELAAALSPRGREFALYDSVIPGFAVRVMPFGTKLWIVRASFRGAPKRITLGNTRSMRMEVARAKAMTITGWTVPSNESVPTLRAFDEHFQRDITCGSTDESIRTFRGRLRNHLLPAFGDLKLDEINTRKIVIWFSGYSRTSPGGANSALEQLRSMINHAKNLEVLPQNYENPCNRIVFNRKERRQRILNDEELARLGHALKRLASVMSLAVDVVLLLLLTGRNLNEVLRLTWQDVKRACKQPAGTDNMLATDAVQRILAKALRYGGNPWVFPQRRDPSKPHSDIRAYWYRIRHEAGLGKDVRLLDLKHTFASRAITSGESRLVVGTLMGHRKLETIMRYGPPSKIDPREAVERIGEIISTSLNAETRRIEEKAAEERELKETIDRAAGRITDGEILRR